MNKVYRRCILGILSLNLFLSFSSGWAQQLSYNEFTTKINEFEIKGEYKEALEYLKIHQNSFPHKYFELSKEEIYINEKLLNYEENISIFSDGHKKGYFYLIHPSIPKYKPYKDLSRFDSISKKDLELRENALLNSKTIYEVELPNTYSKDRLWPAFLIFHGGGSNIKKVKKHWQTEKLNSNFIKIYIQSYRHYDSETFGWGSGDERADQDLMDLFERISSDYSIDSTKIFVSGMSAGGTFAIDISVRQVIPVSGLIAFCPGIPKILSNENHIEISKSHVDVFIVGGEDDYYLPRQKQMTEIFSNLGIVNKHEIINGMGHEYPPNENMWIDTGIHFLLYENLNKHNDN